MNKPVQAVVRLTEGEDGIVMTVRSPTGKLGGILLNELQGEIIRDAFVEWAHNRIDNGYHLPAYLVPPTAEGIVKYANATSLTDDEIDRIYLAMTNGCGEIPYANELKMELEPGDWDYMGWEILVADGQTLCHIHPIFDPEGYESEIAYAMCNAGRAIAQLRNQRVTLQVALDQLRGEIGGIADWVWQGLAERKDVTDVLYALAGAEPGKSDLMEALSILRDLNDVRSLGDLCYDIRDREGLGWDGPKVQKWGAATGRMEKLLEKYPK